MKDAKVIRAYRDDLRRLVQQGTGCTHPDGLCLQCQAVLQAMDQQINLLSWVLDECPDLDHAVEHAAAMARR